jgi:glutamyl-tRNA synthetase
VDQLQADGVEPLALLALLARLGTSQPVEPVADMEPLIAGFDFAYLGRAPARFDEAELAALNARMLHVAPFARVAERLPAAMDETAWLAVRGNLSRVADAAEWWGVIRGPVVAPAMPGERAFLEGAADAASRLDWSAEPWNALTAALKASTGRKGKPLFLPLRRALTGREDGPGMAELLPLIGRDAAVERLQAAATSASD